MKGRIYPDNEGLPLKYCKVEVRNIHNIYEKPRRQKRHVRRLAAHGAQASYFLEELKDLADRMALWLQTADGSRSIENSAKQHASQLNFLVSSYSPRNLDKLLDSDKICDEVESRVSSGEWKTNTANLNVHIGQT